MSRPGEGPAERIRGARSVPPGAPGERRAEGPAERTLRRVRRVVVVFFLVFAVAVTWPGMLPFNRIRPLVLGLPFSLVWPALWIVMGCALLFLLEWAWERAAAERPGPPTARPGPPSSGTTGGEARRAPPGASPERGA